MKARVATVLSLAGVLVTGSAAAVVNSQVLKPDSAATKNEVTARSIEMNQAAPTGSAQLPPAATQAIYLVGVAGSVTLDTAGDVLTVVSIDPDDDWTLVSSANTDPTTVEVSLQSGTTLVQFHAALLYGVVNTSVVTTDLSATTVPATVTPPTHRSTVQHPSTGTTDDHADEPDEPDDD